MQVIHQHGLTDAQPELNVDISSVSNAEPCGCAKNEHLGFGVLHFHILVLGSYHSYLNLKSIYFFPGSTPKLRHLDQVLACAKTLLARPLTACQESWCTPEVLQRFFRGRKGDVRAAAELLAQALEWREQHKELLSGARTPKWQGDLRILAQGEHGHPLVYASHRFPW